MWIGMRLRTQLPLKRGVEMSVEFIILPRQSSCFVLSLTNFSVSLNSFRKFRLNFSMISHACNCVCVFVFVFDNIERVRRAMNAFGYFICEPRKEEGNKSKNKISKS